MLDPACARSSRSPSSLVARSSPEVSLTIRVPSSTVRVNRPSNPLTVSRPSSFRASTSLRRRASTSTRTRGLRRQPNHPGRRRRTSGSAGSHTYRLRPSAERDRRAESVRQALQTVARRVNELGVSEPIVARHGAAGDQILVQLPGVEDVAEAKAVIRSMGRLDITLIEEGPAPTRDRLLATRNGVVPADTEVVAGGSSPWHCSCSPTTGSPASTRWSW